MIYSTIFTEETNKILLSHLIREDGQEDLCFALYHPSVGEKRYSSLIDIVVLPEYKDRVVHGNVSFNVCYLDRVIDLAIQAEMGIAFIHSHPCPGWQDMSEDDIEAEIMLSSRIKAATGLPLVGMTVGSDGTWSSRFWIKVAPRTYEKIWCQSVRVVGKSFTTNFDEEQFSTLTHREEFCRTISAWGEARQTAISRLKIGIVGLGSVGSQLTEGLAKTGIKDFVLVDFDRIERKNLDRMLSTNHHDIGRLKVDFYGEHIRKVSPSEDLNIVTIEQSVASKKALIALLDCDIVFSCVDRPYPRYILNHIAYANLIPIIDGGIDASINSQSSNIFQARWRAIVAGPGRRCLECCGQYTPEDVSLEISGLLEDPQYIKGLPETHFAKRGENVYIFSHSTASMMMLQFLSLLLRPKGVFYGIKEMDFVTGNIDADFEFSCDSNCLTKSIEAKGDKVNQVIIMEEALDS